ncbi:ABC transporter ATP-binding protein [Streptomyces sp. HNM0645]|uniref:ABC transporter ATP-binding protein n=1 Tax=Streptomyces sp. HNM0645 TaxID=2782343 RepID=UPI0024B75009|nr:ABC transporter ATP-binding protein [Streptomyces sp. HNM0645]MDI9884288.1 ABC transporter ATP-binding protein [Streptomyces sp. HNM0645]
MTTQRPAPVAGDRTRGVDGPSGSGGARSLLTDAVRESAGRTAALVAAGLLSAGAAIALPALLGRSLDLVLAGAAEAGPWLALCAALVVADILCDAASAHLTGTLTAVSAARIRRRALGRVLAAGPRAAERFTGGDLVTRLTANVTEAATTPATAAAAVPALVLPVGGLVALAVTDLWTAAVFVAGAPLLVLLVRAFTRETSAGVAEYQKVQGNIAARLVEALDGARTVAAAGTWERERARILAPLPELAARGRHMWHVYGRAVARGAVLLPLLETGVLAVGGLRVAAGEMSVGELLAALRYAALAAGVGAVVGQLSGLLRGRAAARRTAEAMAVPVIAYGKRGLPADGPGRLEFRAVSVVRDGRTVLGGVDLVVPGGATLALVGRSGSGKTALARLPGRLDDPDAGTVFLDGVPVAEIERDVLRREVAYAFERPALFGATVREAIAFGPCEPSMTEVTGAARAAGADAFVRRLPDGYATPLTRAPLSGGEAQRLGLARAFAHAGRLLVLDDATSSLDSVTERQVARALLYQVRPGTRLVVAHRVSSAARADLVAWLDGGRVRAVGPHAALWALPEYRAVFAAPGEAPDRVPGTAGADAVPGVARAGDGTARDGRAASSRPTEHRATPSRSAANQATPHHRPDDHGPGSDPAEGHQLTGGTA